MIEVKVKIQPHLVEVIAGDLSAMCERGTEETSIKLVELLLAELVEFAVGSVDTRATVWLAALTRYQQTMQRPAAA